MDPRLLREATRLEHEKTEALMPLGGPEVSRETYIRVLQVLRALIGAWETWAAEAAPQDLRELLRGRLRAHLLDKDLASLGASPAGAPGGEIDWAEVVRGGDPLASGTDGFRAAFLGAVYVMEGSTLGGRYIARHIQAILGLEDGAGYAYFQGHGEATGGMWREVTALLTALPDALDPVVVGAAKRTFQAFGARLRSGLDAAGDVHG